MRICAGGLLVWDGRILLARRADDRVFYPGVWDVPGGHCTGSEAPAETLVRELQEEVGITATVFEQVAVLEGPRPTDYGDARYHMFVVSGWAGEPQLQGSEHSELRWMNLGQALALPLAHPEYRQLFRGVLASGGEGGRTI
jgi:8-oxo-dGTP diphosphatase